MQFTNFSFLKIIAASKIESQEIKISKIEIKFCKLHFSMRNFVQLKLKLSRKISNLK